MIKENDLRLNNLVKWNDSIQKITAIAFGNCLLDKNPTADYPVKITEIEPIYLTEEWLLKAGFEKNLILRVFTIKEHIDFVIINYVDTDKTFRLFINCKSINIKYVHQLQNLYFALHHEELVFSSDRQHLCMYHKTKLKN